ncbi:MAG: 50S ribosome-binding GTPase [Candidatus Helarchaeota archaeon]|nr:50S ribosome-binding GTPase [Candidatus Helarchaeota archaeon]
MKSPFSDMITIDKPQELLDIAFKRGSKVEIKFRPRTPDIIKAKKREMARINTVTDNLVKRFTKMIKTFPTFENLHPFYYDLVKTLVDIDEFRKIIASLSSALKILKKIHQEHFNKIKRARDPTVAGDARKAFYGRISSVINRLEEKLDYLREQRNILRKLPSISPEIFTIVVAGYPNVGKSSLVQAISTAKPEISYYPFTTRNLIVGHRILDEDDPIPQKIQILDTPGLLDRPLSRRNNIELKAIVALKHLANVIVFMIDPSETCGYQIANQTHLLKEIRDTFQNIPFIINLNKIDIVQSEQISQVKKEIKEIFPEEELPILETIAVKEEGVEDIYDSAMKYYPNEL